MFLRVPVLGVVKREAKRKTTKGHTHVEIGPPFWFRVNLRSRKVQDTVGGMRKVPVCDRSNKQSHVKKPASMSEAVATRAALVQVKPCPKSTVRIGHFATKALSEHKL